MCHISSHAGKRWELYYKEVWQDSKNLLFSHLKKQGHHSTNVVWIEPRGLLVVAAAAASAADDASTSDYQQQCVQYRDSNWNYWWFDWFNELENLRTENIQLHSDVERLSSYYDQSAFVDKDENLFHWSTYLHGSFCPHLPVKKLLNKFKQLMLTLLWLRLNVSTNFQAYLFNVSSTALRP